MFGQGAFQIADVFIENRRHGAAVETACAVAQGEGEQQWPFLWKSQL